MLEQWWELPPSPLQRLTAVGLCIVTHAVRPVGGDFRHLVHRRRAYSKQSGLALWVGDLSLRCTGPRTWKDPTLASLLCSLSPKFLIIYELGAPHLLVWHCPSEIML